MPLKKSIFYGLEAIIQGLFFQVRFILSLGPNKDEPYLEKSTGGQESQKQAINGKSLFEGLEPPSGFFQVRFILVWAQGKDEPYLEKSLVDFSK